MGNYELNNFEIGCKAAQLLDEARLATFGNLGNCSTFDEENDAFLFERLSQTIHTLCDRYRQTKDTHLLTLALKCKRAQLLLSISLGLGVKGYLSPKEITVLDSKEGRLRTLCEYAKGDENFIFQCHSMYKYNALTVK